jgi:hypothetical protein
VSGGLANAASATSKVAEALAQANAPRSGLTVLGASGRHCARRGSCRARKLLAQPPQQVLRGSGRSTGLERRRLPAQLGEAAPGEPAALAGAALSPRTPLPRKEAAGNAGQVSTIFGMVSLIAFFGEPWRVGDQVAPPPDDRTDPAGCNPP